MDIATRFFTSGFFRPTVRAGPTDLPKNYFDFFPYPLSYLIIWVRTSELCYASVIDTDEKFLDIVNDSFARVFFLQSFTGVNDTADELFLTCVNNT
jgi:hypothetical protein